MYDAFHYYSERLDGSEPGDLLDFSGNPLALPERFYYMTCHRQENTDTDEKLGTKACFNSAYQPFGDGHSAEKTVEKIKEFFG